MNFFNLPRIDVYIPNSPTSFQSKKNDLFYRFINNYDSTTKDLNTIVVNKTSSSSTTTTSSSSGSTATNKRKNSRANSFSHYSKSHLSEIKTRLLKKITSKKGKVK